MSRSSNAVKEWRKKTKRRIIESMGGKCACCGYNRCDNALSLHHLDPSKKELSFGKIRANPKNWKTIVDELKKCILVCNNCHSEIHANFIKIPVDGPIFNEQYSEYKINKCFEKTFCVVCGKEKQFNNITCSTICAAKRAGKIDWDKYDLLKMLETMTFVKIADEIGCSDSAVHKRFKKIKHTSVYTES